MESILREAGSCGRYQVIHLFFAQLPRFLASWVLMFMMFGAFNPGWRCGSLDEADVYLSNRSNDSVPFNASGSFGGNVSYDVIGNAESDLDSEDSGLYNGTCDMVDQCQGHIQFNPSSSTITTEFKLVCDRAWFLRAILLVQSTGILLVPLLVGQIGDKFGRKFSLYGCTAIICVFTGIAIFSHHWVMFAICYFFIGGAGNATLGISPVFSLEVLNSKWRGYYNSIPVANIAMFLFTIVSSVVKDWVYLHVITCIFAFGSCIGFLIVPESPRWLVVNGQVLKAEEAIQTIAKLNRRDRIDKASFRKFRAEVKKQGSIKAYSIIDLFRNRQLGILTLKFCVIFLALSVTYMSIMYGLSALPGDYYTNAIFATVIEIVFVTASGPLCNVIGRRLTGLVCGIVGTISCVVVVVVLATVDEGEARNWVVNAFAYFAKSSSQAMFCVGTTLNAELFPTVVRGAVSGLIRCCVGVGGLIIPFLLPSKDTSSLVVYFSIMSACYLLISIIFPTFPETNRCSLSDNLLQLRRDDGKDVALSLSNNSYDDNNEDNDGDVDDNAAIDDDSNGHCADGQKVDDGAGATDDHVEADDQDFLPFADNDDETDAMIQGDDNDSNSHPSTIVSS